MAEPSVAKRPEVTQGAGPARRTPDAHAATSGAPAAQRQYMAQLAQEQKGTQGAAPPAAGGARTPGQKQAALKKVNLGAVKVLETGFGDIELVLSQHINASGDPTTAASKRLAVGGPIDNMELRWSDAPNMIPLGKTSRSTRFIVTATGALCVMNPLKLIKFAPGS
jgi:hypothetical protein